MVISHIKAVGMVTSHKALVCVQSKAIMGCCMALSCALPGVTGGLAIRTWNGYIARQATKS